MGGGMVKTLVAAMRNFGRGPAQRRAFREPKGYQLRKYFFPKMRQRKPIAIVNPNRALPLGMQPIVNPAPGSRACYTRPPLSPSYGP